MNGAVWIVTDRYAKLHLVKLAVRGQAGNDAVRSMELAVEADRLLKHLERELFAPPQNSTPAKK